MAKTDPQVNIRMPEVLLERLRQEAKSRGQTLAAEMISRLEASFPKRFDLLILESRQRELEVLSSSRIQMEIALWEAQVQMRDAEVAELRKEVRRMKDQEKQMWQEINQMYAALNDKENVALPIGPPT